MKITSTEIDKKVCATKKTTTSGSNFSKYAEETSGTRNDTKVALCGGEPNGDGSAGTNTEQQFLHDFVRETLKGDSSKNWPTSTGKANGGKTR
ncbi:putative p44-77 outer membrane protein, silent [Anaplasma phagocytophilum str. ApNP]|uniref:Putative p44-77 outer membrane protein, silent n=1 Tax=Anaplasma phagocytophilum str. ApNP TaxID=1359153 RepID=A0A0F3NJN5_ANAPH|nr:putative p44-77 outer membrane protein, silent [Anaplasma phagocytophilum str. ApNP]